MSSVIDTASPGSEHDAADLATFGYPQQLHRRLGSYASFAAGFSFVSILTTVFQLFAFGFSFGGPAFVWTWPVVFGGQLLVALNFAELASRYPIAGCIYQWSRRVSGGLIGWFAGWLMLVGQIVSVAAAAIALQVVLPSIWPGFQLFGGNPSLASSSGATNAVLLGAILILLTTAINVIGVRVMAVINSVGVTAELIGVALLIALLFVHARRSPSVVFATNGVQGHGSYVWPLLASALMAAYVMYGFDSAGELSEETRSPRRTAPRAILRALVVSGVGGGLLLVAALMAAPSIHSPQLGTVGLPYVITSRLGSGVGKALLVDVAVAISVCTLAIQTAASRLMFSMSRDQVLPLSAKLGRISRRTGTPIMPSILVGLLAVSILVVNLGQAQLFAAVTSVAVVIVYLAYLLVTGPLLVQRLRGRYGAAVEEETRSPARPFTLGRWGLAVNIGAVAYGAGMAVNIAWPRAAVYDPAGGHWYLQYFSVLFVLAVLAVGWAVSGQRSAVGTVAAGAVRLDLAEGSGTR